MLFNSYVFILAAFPVGLLVYYLLGGLKKNKLALWWLVLFSLYFYGYFNWKYLIIICASIGINYLLSMQMIKKTKIKRTIFTLGIVLNVLVIYIFKYYDFFVSNINSLFGANLNLLKLIMPLGISFFTFQQIAYLADVYHERINVPAFCEYALFVSFFPQLIAGPIVYSEEMIPQFRDEKNRRFSPKSFSEGTFFFATGLAKKVLLADTLGKGVDWGFSNIPSLTGISALWVSLFYTFQLYFDFSGYCDMAVGISKCFNIELPQNFNSPYKAISIGDFWKRWHMSLTRFLTKYVYIPLGGNRKGVTRTYINILLVFLISGIWHGAGWTYILWGLLHGIASVTDRIIKKCWDKIPKLACGFMTFLFCNFAWVIFRANSITDAFMVLKKIFTPNEFYFSTVNELARQFDVMEFVFLKEHITPLNSLCNAVPSFVLVVLGTISGLIIWAVPNNWNIKRKITPVSAIFIPVLLLWSLFSLSGVSPFLYFNF